MMKGKLNWLKKSLLVFGLVSLFAVGGCTTQPVDPDNGGGDSGQGTDGGTGGPATPYKGFGVQLFASASEARAKEILETFTKEGYEGVVVPLVVDGKTLYKTQIGPFETEAEAEAQLAQMKQRYKKNEFVNDAVIKENK